MDNPRKLAHLSLIKGDTQECFTNIEINTVLSRAVLEKSDASLYTLLYLGVTEKRMLLDYIIGKYSKTAVEDIDLEALNAIRLGLYQLIFTDRIPDYSAVDESVSLAPKRAKGFVNAILRSFLRDGKQISYPKDKWERLSVENSIPMSIIDLFKASYGEELAEKIVSHREQCSCLSLRVNTLKTKGEDMFSELEKRGCSPRYSDYGRGVIKCTAAIREIKDLIDTGCVFVQDESSYVCARALGAQAGENIADVCACPGGKTFSVALEMENIGKIQAYDLHKSKLSLVEKGAKRLGIDIISVAEQNAKELVPENVGAFDRVLCDVPCSGLGVIFKKPEIKYKSIDKINALPSVQYDILKNVSRYVRAGGVLVYSTCTLCKAENEDNVLKFLAESSDFEPLDFEIGTVKSQNGMYTFFPHATGTDGFFVAKLKRKR